MTTVVALIPVTRVCDLDLRVRPRRIFEPLGLRRSPDTGWEARSSYLGRPSCSPSLCLLWLSMTCPANPGPERTLGIWAELWGATGSGPGCWSLLDASGKLWSLGGPA